MTAGTVSKANVLAFSGGVGGAKLASGLYHTLAPWQLGIVSNTGDDFLHYDLHIAPDTDTLMYTLSGESNDVQGWGRSGESWTFMEQIKRLGDEGWFQLGDGDLALHVRRTQLLRSGIKLSDVTRELFGRYDITAHIHPMSDDAVRTRVHCQDGRTLPFQEYFVKEQCTPDVSGFSYDGADAARPNLAVIETLSDPDLQAVILCPSNPYLSIHPILAVPGIRQALADCEAPVVAVSPIVGGLAIKGPLGKILSDLGKAPTCANISAMYCDFLDGFVIDHEDAKERDACGVATLVTGTIMDSAESRRRLAGEILDFAKCLSKRN